MNSVAWAALAAGAAGTIATSVGCYLAGRSRRGRLIARHVSQRVSVAARRASGWWSAPRDSDPFRVDPAELEAAGHQVRLLSLLRPTLLSLPYHSPYI